MKIGLDVWSWSLSDSIMDKFIGLLQRFGICFEEENSTRLGIALRFGWQVHSRNRNSLAIPVITSQSPKAKILLSSPLEFLANKL